MQSVSLVFEPLRVQSDLSPFPIGRSLPGASWRLGRLMFFFPANGTRSSSYGQLWSRVSTWQPLLSLIAASVTVSGGKGEGG